LTLDSQGSGERRAGLAVLGAFAGVSILFTGLFPPNGNPNELSRFQAIYAYVETGTFSIDDALRRFGDHEDKSVANGHFYSNKAPGLAFAAIPVYRALRVFFPAPRKAWDPVFVLTRLATVTLLSIVAAAVFLRRVRGRTEGTLVAAALLFGTPFLFYARSFFGHAWTAALLFLAWELARSRDPRGREDLRNAAAGFLAGWASISEYTTAPLAALLAIRTLRRDSLRGLAFFAAGAALPLALLLLYNRACFGSPWVLSSAREARPDFAALAGHGLFGFGPPSPKIGWAYLFDPARGLLWRSPFWIWVVPGFLAWWRSGRERADCVFALVSVAAFFVLLTGYGNWHGGWSLGNRYLLPVLFLAGLAVAHGLESPLSRGLFAAAVVFSAATNLLMSLTWPYFPDDLSWPAASGSLWFLARGWIAPSWLPGLPALLLGTAACALAVIVPLRVARPGAPRYSLGAAAGLSLFVLALAVPPSPSFSGRLFRTSMYGAFSGLDPSREELKAVVLSASTDAEKRMAASIWRRFGPRPPRPR
jgi:hypothetical protein